MWLISYLCTSFLVLPSLLHPSISLFVYTCIYSHKQLQINENKLTIKKSQNLVSVSLMNCMNNKLQCWYTSPNMISRKTISALNCQWVAWVGIEPTVTVASYLQQSYFLVCITVLTSGLQIMHDDGLMAIENLMHGV